MTRRLMLLGAAALLVAAACGDDDSATTTTAAPTTATPTTGAAAPPTAPADVVFEGQASDGASIVVASVTLPAPGFIAVHGNADGGPGPVIGNSDLLPEGTSTDVTVPLFEPLEATDLVFPMAHIDVNGNGVYEFFPPDETIDGPAFFTEGGDVAVVGGEVTVNGEAGGEAAQITIADFAFGGSVTASVGQTVTVTNEDGVTHTFTSTDGVFDSGPLASGEQFSATFDTAGDFAFFCSIHPAMTGTITVTG